VNEVSAANRCVVSAWIFICL